MENAARLRYLVTTFALILPLTAHGGFDEGIQAYESGDYAKALAEFKPLAEQGDPRAQTATGSLYHYGYGVEMNQLEAIKWYRMAADRGYSLAEQYLGMIYQRGDGVSRDLVAAHMWFSLFVSSTPNDRDRLYTQRLIKELEGKMSEEQIARAKEMARNWRPATSDSSPGTQR